MESCHEVGVDGIRQEVKQKESKHWKKQRIATALASLQHMDLFS